MLTRPVAIVPILAPFATLFTSPTWRKAQLLLAGTILATGQRTVAAALRVMGRSDQRDFARYHGVLNRAVWSPREAARILLLLLLQHLDHGDGPLIFGVRSLTNRETLERRRGARISARGIYRDAVRSSRHQLVKASGRDCSQIWDLPDVAGQCPLVGTALGLAGAHRVGAIVAVLPTTRTPAQEDHRLGPADGHTVAPVAAPSTPGAGGRQRLRRPRSPPLLPIPASAGYSDCQTAPGRCPLCSSARPSAWAEWPTAAERPPATFAEIPPCTGSSGLDHTSPRCPGTTVPPAPWNSPPRPPSGTVRANLPSPSAFLILQPHMIGEA